MNELFETLYDEYYRKVYGYYYLCFSNREIAEDLTQTVFMKIYRYLDKSRFFMPDSWKAWIFRVTVNVKNDYLRSLRRQVKCEDIEEIVISDTLHNPENTIDSISVNNALKKLKESDRDIIELKNKGYSSSEIGCYMGLCDSTVRSRTQSAKQKLSLLLKAEEISFNN